MSRFFILFVIKGLHRFYNFKVFPNLKLTLYMKNNWISHLVWFNLSYLPIIAWWSSVKKMELNYCNKYLYIQHVSKLIYFKRIFEYVGPVILQVFKHCMEIIWNESEMDLSNEVLRQQNEKMDCGMLCILIFFFSDQY